MDLQALNVDLVQKLSLALVIIRNTPPGIRPDVFTRSLAKSLFPPPDRSAQLVSLLDDHLLLRQQELLTRLLPPPSSFASSISLMDLSALNTVNEQSSNEYEFGDFAEKVCQLKDEHYHLKVPDIEFLLQMLMKWLMNIDIDNRGLPVDACLYTVQVMATKLQTDDHKPYHLVLDLLPLIDRFLDCLLDRIEQTADKNVPHLHQMIISLGKSLQRHEREIRFFFFQLRQIRVFRVFSTRSAHVFDSSVKTSMMNTIDSLLWSIPSIVYSIFCMKSFTIAVFSNAASRKDPSINCPHWWINCSVNSMAKPTPVISWNSKDNYRLATIIELTYRERPFEVIPVRVAVNIRNVKSRSTPPAKY